MIKIVSGDPDVIQQIRDFRTRVFLESRRDIRYVSDWAGDDYDQESIHVIMSEEDGPEPVATVRVIAHAGRWPVEDRISPDVIIDKLYGAEFGRLAVAQRYSGGRRNLFELMRAACQYCLEIDRPTMYGLMIDPFWNALARAGVPLQVISDPIPAYGEVENVVRFDARELLNYYDMMTAGSKRI
jgi:hypothetical protein